MNWKRLLIQQKIPIGIVFTILLIFIFLQPSSKEGFDTNIEIPNDLPEEGKISLRNLRDPDKMCPLLSTQQGVMKTQQDEVAKTANQDNIQSHTDILNVLLDKMKALGCPNLPDKLPNVIKVTAP